MHKEGRREGEQQVNEGEEDDPGPGGCTVLEGARSWGVHGPGGCRLHVWPLLHRASLGVCVAVSSPHFGPIHASPEVGGGGCWCWGGVGVAFVGPSLRRPPQGQMQVHGAVQSLLVSCPSPLSHLVPYMYTIQ